MLITVWMDSKFTTLIRIITKKEEEIELHSVIFLLKTLPLIS